MILTRIATVAILMLTLLATARADTAPPVLKTIDIGWEIYETETGQGCAVQLWLIHQLPGHRSISLRRPPASCEPALNDHMAAVGRLLESMASDGIVIRDVNGFGLGRVEHGAWKQQAADCFLRTRDTRSRRAPDQSVVAQILAKCDVFPELKAVFEKFGAQLVLSGASRRCRQSS